MKILIVDDDRGTLNAIRAGLISVGYQVTAADSGEVAMDLIRASHGDGERPRVVVTDLKMAGMTGLDLIHSARQIDPGLAFILMTAYGNERVRQEVARLGRCGYIEKPFRPEGLLALIQSLLSTKDAPEETPNRVTREGLGGHV